MDAAVQLRRDPPPPLLAAERTDRVVKVERRFDRAPDIVLARLRMAERGEHSVRAGLRDLPFVPADDPVEDRLDTPEQVARGEIFGELAAIDGQVRSATIVALSDCALASIPAGVFCAAIDEIPGGWLWLARRLSGQVRDLTSRLLERNAFRVKSRLHCELLRRCREVSAGEDIVHLQPSPTHAQLAACIGTHREAVTREFGYLVDSGIVQQQRRCIVVNDTRALANLVQRAVGERTEAPQLRLG